MALVPHKITALAESDAQGTDGKNIVSGAVVSLYDTSGTVVTLFDDANGSNGSTAKQTDSSGQVVVYVTAGEYDEEVNGSIKRRVSIGGNGLTSYPTTASLESSRPTKTGQRAENRERGNAQYVLADSGYTALPGDVVAANGRVWALQKWGGMPVTQFGMVGDGLTDNKDLWKGVCDYLNESKGSVVVPSGVFAVTRGAALFHGTITHEDGGIIRNTANVGNSARFWENTALFAGTYFGYDSPYGTSGETQYNVNPASSGDSEVTFVNASDSSNFSVGDVVFIKSGEVYPSTDFSTGSHVTKVKSVSSGVIELRDKICIDINAGGGNCVIAKQSSTLPLVNSFTGRDEVAKCADGLKIINGQYESLALENSQVIHISSIDCDFDFKKVQGQSPFGINPCAHTVFNCKEGNFTLRGGEFAYFHQNVYSDLMVFNRIGDPTNDNIPSAPLDFSEYGNSKYLGTVVINDGLATQNTSFSSLGFTTPYNHASKLVVNGSNGGNAVSFAAGRAYGSTVDLIEVIGSAGGGIIVDSPDVTINKASVRGMSSASSRALQFGSNSSSSSVDRLVTPATDARHTALDLNPGNGNTVKSGLVYTRQDEARELAVVNYAGTGSTETIKTYTIPAGTSTKRGVWRAKVIGNITGSSTNGSKVIRLRAGSAGATLNVGVSATGFFELNLTFSKLNDNLNQLVSASYQFNGGTVSSFNGIQAINMATTNTDITFDANMAVGDSFNLREWSVTPGDDIVDI